jgi:hypothetical protein
MEIRHLRFMGKVVFLLLSSLVVQARGTVESNFCWGQAATTNQKTDTSIQNNKVLADKVKKEFLIDQANEVLHQQYSYNIGFLKPIGQEFFPTLHALDAVELIIDDANCSEAGGTGGSLKVAIHEGEITGPVIGTSKTTSFPNCFYNIIRFEFPSFIPLTPGKKYVIEPVYVSGNTSTVYVDKGPSPLYKQGNFIFQGAPEPEMDMWFREGLSKSIAQKSAQAKNGGWKKLVRANGTPFKSERECLSYIKSVKK